MFTPEPAGHWMSIGLDFFSIPQRSHLTFPWIILQRGLSINQQILRLSWILKVQICKNLTLLASWNYYKSIWKMFPFKHKTSCIWKHKCHISDYQILPWNWTDPGRMFAKQKRTLLCFSFGFLSHWAGFVVLSPVAREWPRKTNISVREEGEPQYIPPTQNILGRNHQLISRNGYKTSVFLLTCKMGRLFWDEKDNFFFCPWLRGSSHYPAVTGNTQEMDQTMKGSFLLKLTVS